jgi:hypothetical protein
MCPLNFTENEKTLRSLVAASPKPNAGIRPSISKHSNVLPKISMTLNDFQKVNLCVHQHFNSYTTIVKYLLIWVFDGAIAVVQRSAVECLGSVL